MRVHRFFAEQKFEAGKPAEINNSRLTKQWFKVLRFRPGSQLILFDGAGWEALYEITYASQSTYKLEFIKKLKPVMPRRQSYLFWSLLKRTNNELVLQKCTEIGVTHFVPLIASRTQKTGFSEERAKKIVIEASEQCGRGDTPEIYEPMELSRAIIEFSKKVKLYTADKSGVAVLEKHELRPNSLGVGVMIGPEGGWSDEEKKTFRTNKLETMQLGNLTLRAETACVVAAAKLLL